MVVSEFQGSQYVDESSTEVVDVVEDLGGSNIWGGHFLTLTSAEYPPAPIDKRMTSPGRAVYFFSKSLPTGLTVVQHL